jgi:DNA-binding transcriptional LysR family regulator
VNALNLKQLEALREVMLTGSVSEAARNIGRTQPAVSSLIVALESAIGCELFERHAGRLYPLPEAHYLFEEAKGLLDQLADIQRTMAAIRDIKQGELRIASMSALSFSFSPK